MLDWDFVVEALAREGARLRAGGEVGLPRPHLRVAGGRIACRVSGRPLADFVREEIARPP